MSRRLPSDLLGDPLFRQQLRQIMRGYSGIYALHKGRKLYYVGLTGDLFRRIRRHMRDRHARKWDHFLIFRIEKVRYLKDIETLIHHLVETRGNRVKGRVPRDSDINHALRALVSGYKRSLRGVERALR